MSNRNSQANKQAARERLREERARQAKRAKVRRQLTVAGGIVAVLAIAGGVGYAVSNATGGSDNSKLSSSAWKKQAEKKKLVTPAHTSGKDGTTLIVGDKNAKNVLHVYEDMRCPICAQFEQNTGSTVLKDIDNGTFRAQYTMGTFLDDNKQISGSGSKNALSALGAAINVGPDAFLDYKKTLYSKKNHPDETNDAFSDRQKLIKIAQQVPELKGNKKFESAVKHGTYDRWALAMSDSFNHAKGVTGTPTFKFNGKPLTVDGKNPPMTPSQFTPLIQKLKK